MVRAESMSRRECQVLVGVAATMNFLVLLMLVMALRVRGWRVGGNANTFVHAFFSRITRHRFSFNPALQKPKPHPLHRADGDKGVKRRVGLLNPLAVSPSAVAAAHGATRVSSRVSKVSEPCPVFPTAPTASTASTVWTQAHLLHAVRRR